MSSEEEKTTAKKVIDAIKKIIGVIGLYFISLIISIFLVSLVVAGVLEVFGVRRMPRIGIDNVPLHVYLIPIVFLLCPFIAEGLRILFRWMEGKIEEANKIRDENASDGRSGFLPALVFVFYISIAKNLRALFHHIAVYYQTSQNPITKGVRAFFYLVKDKIKKTIDQNSPIGRVLLPTDSVNMRLNILIVIAILILIAFLFD